MLNLRAHRLRGKLKLFQRELLEKALVYFRSLTTLVKYLGVKKWTGLREI
jgi:hypothetical protein